MLQKTRSMISYFIAIPLSHYLSPLLLTYITGYPSFIVSPAVPMTASLIVYPLSFVTYWIITPIPNTEIEMTSFSSNEWVMIDQKNVQ